ncbi:MAG: MFS transporter [Candidatus Dormibacteria bacterium]
MAAGGQVAAPAADASATARVLYLVSASHATQHIYQALLPLTYPAILVTFHLTVGTLGLAVGVVGLLGGLCQVTAGPVARRINARWILGPQNLALGLCSLAGSWAPVYPFFVGAQGVAQLASSQQHPVGSSIVARAFPSRRGMALSTHNIGGSVGSLLVPLPAAVLISRLGWRPTLLLLAVPLLVMGLLFVLTFPGMPREPASPDAARRRLFAGMRLHRSQFLDPRVALFGVLAATVAAAGRGIGTLNTYIPLFLRDQVHLSLIAVGAVFNLVLLGAVLGPYLGGRVSDRLGRLPVLWTVYLASAPVIVLFGFSAHFPLAVTLVMATLVGLVVYVENPLLQALVSDAVTAPAQATVFGVYFAVAYGVGSLWLILLGWVIQHVGFSAAFCVMAACYLGAAALLLPCRGRVGARSRA